MPSLPLQIIFAAFMSAALFCYGIYAPSEIMSRTITDYQVGSLLSRRFLGGSPPPLWP